jgi:branched-chain amino acid aminotransferase
LQFGLVVAKRTLHQLIRVGANSVGAVVYLNGQFVSPEEAKISIFDHGYLFGDGIFETLRSYGGAIFKLPQHLNRLFDSARYMRMVIPLSSGDLEKLCHEALQRSSLKDAYLRITVSRGVGARGIDPDHCKTPTLSIIVKDLPYYPVECYSSGIATRIVSIRKFSADSSSSRVKGCNYQHNILAKIELNQHGMIEGLLLNNEGFVAEGTVSNVFVVNNGIISTPSLACGCLEGITRNTVIDLAAQKCGLTVRQTQITRYELYTADECFVTNTIMELIPVVTIDGRTIGQGTPGPTTRALAGLYQDLVKNEG